MPIQVHDLFKHSDLTLIVEVSNNNLTWVKFGQNRSVDNLSRCRDGDLDIPTLEFRFKVSSHILWMASKYFKRVLEDSDFFQPSHQLSATKAIHLTNGEDHVALLLLLECLHQTDKNIPTELNIDTLTELAYLVETYKLWSSLYTISGTWLKQNIELSFYLLGLRDCDFAKLIYCSWVFRYPKYFYKITSKLIWETSDLIEVEKYIWCFPKDIGLDNVLNKHRLMIINTILAKMKSLLDRLFQTEVECSPRCDESTREDINRLYREIKRSGPLFKQWSVRRVVQDVLYRQIPCWHANQGGDLSDAFTFYNYAKPGNAQWQQDQKLCRVNQELEDFLVEKDNSRVHGMEYSRTWAPRNWKRARSINECQYQRDLGDNDSSSLTAVDSSDDDRLSVEI